MYERLILERGQFGPLRAPMELEIRPLTLFIGPQGSGKSLLSELLYFFRDVRYLLYRSRERRGPSGTLTNALRSLRAGEKTHRAISVFVGQEQDARWSYTISDTPSQRYTWSLSIRRNNRVDALGTFKHQVVTWIETWEAYPEEPSPRAIFIPAERTYFSRFINVDPQMLGHRGLPIPVRELSRHLVNSKPPFESQDALLVGEWAREALKGEVVYETRGRYAGTWQWQLLDSQRRIDIELVSSGQMETWPLVVIAQMLLDRREQEGMEFLPRFIHIEEPESHLFPEAQVAVASILALLIKRGFWITVTTHSTDFVFALNNLLAAGSLLGEDIRDKELPPPEIRLKPEDVAVYLIDEGKSRSLNLWFHTPQHLLNPQKLWITLGELWKTVHKWG